MDNPPGKHGGRCCPPGGSSPRRSCSAWQPCTKRNRPSYARGRRRAAPPAKPHRSRKDGLGPPKNTAHPHPPPPPRQHAGPTRDTSSEQADKTKPSKSKGSAIVFMCPTIIRRRRTPIYPEASAYPCRSIDNAGSDCEVNPALCARPSHPLMKGSNSSFERSVCAKAPAFS